MNAAVDINNKFPVGIHGVNGLQPQSGGYQAAASFYALKVKRFFDVVFSLLFIILLLSWIIPFMFLLIKLTSKGPLFFRQERIGLNGKSFSCIKFRTMYVNHLSEKLQAQFDDRRITPVGLFLRITHIDELPQLFNVLLNEMSIVGPRPHMLIHDQYFSGLIKEYPYRHQVKPGITGLAQSLGYHGNTPDPVSISNRTKLDLFYVKKVSFLLDLRIIIKTFLLIPVSVFKYYKHGNDED